MLDQKEWSANYDSYILECEEEIHRQDMATTDKELAEACFYKGINPQDVDQAEIFGSDRLANMDQMDQDTRQSNLLALRFLEKEERIKV